MLNMNTMTLQERVHRRSGHIAVAYKDSLLVWGGFMETPSDSNNPTQSNDQCAYHFTDEIWVYEHDTELWNRLLTSGDIPPPTCGSCGVVLNDSLYVFGGFCHGDSLIGNTDRLYRLDLQKLQWQLLSPEGQAPAPCDKLVGWAYGNKIYLFGGFGPTPQFYPSFDFVIDPSTEDATEPRGWNNQLVTYDPSTNSWVWPKVNGDLPCPRAAHAVDVTGDKAYIFGGRYMISRRNDLYCLDLPTMTWTNIEYMPLAGTDQGPSRRSWHSFTFISPTRAILYGGLNNYNFILNDCWCLDVEKNVCYRIFRRYTQPNSKEDPIKLHSFPQGRFWHQVVASPGKEMLCVIGGTVALTNQLQSTRDHAEELLVLEFIPKSLFRLSMDAVLMNVPVKCWFEQLILPKEIENLLVLRLEQNPTLSLLR